MAKCTGCVKHGLDAKVGFASVRGESEELGMTFRTPYDSKSDLVVWEVISNESRKIFNRYYN